MIYYQVRQTLDDILDKVPEPFNTQDMMSRVDERTPYVVVSFQECERMNILMSEIRRSLKELQLGLKVIIIRQNKFIKKIQNTTILHFIIYKENLYTNMPYIVHMHLFIDMKYKYII